MKSLFLIILSISLSAQVNRTLKVTKLAENEFCLVIDSALHEDYGMAYPITYEFSFDNIPKGVLLEKKSKWKASYKKVAEKKITDFYNGIEALRVEVDSQKAYVSVSFDEQSDSVYLRFSGYKKKPFPATFSRITPYYDNRKAVVTCTADDWSDYELESFDRFLNLCRSKKIWVTAGIITCKSENSWSRIQSQIDSGMIEAAAHSCNHLHTPYKDPAAEVSGCKSQIINQLVLDKTFRKGKREYVYPWLAPFGEYDNITDSIVSKEKFLVSRKVNASDFEVATWQESSGKFSNIGMAYEMGDAPWGGVRDLTKLNETFNKVYNEGKVYHFMVHPFVLKQYGSWEKNYIEPHLDHIANRNDVWYVALGHLYVYRLLKN